MGGRVLLTYIRNGECIKVFLSGEIDQRMADEIRGETEALLADRTIRRLLLDFEDVSFMDSSGIGMVIGRYKTMKARGGTVAAEGLHPPIDRVFRLSGLHRIIETECGRKEA